LFSLHGSVDARSICGAGTLDVDPGYTLDTFGNDLVRFIHRVIGRSTTVIEWAATVE